MFSKLVVALNEISKRSYVSAKGQVHSLTLAEGHSDFKIKSCFSQKLLGHLKPNFYES